MTSGDAPRQVRVFINYRHRDTYKRLRDLYDRLVSTFGSGNVFVDVPSLKPGMNWPEEIDSCIDSCDVFLALIGPSWISLMEEHEQGHTKDHARAEILRALRGDPDRVIPVFMGNNVSLKKEDLSWQLKALADRQAALVHDEHFGEYFDEDVERLIGRICKVAAREQPAIPLEPARAREEGSRPAPAPARTGSVTLPLDDTHYEDVLEQMIDYGNVVPFLGPQMPAGHASTPGGPPPAPDAEQLAATLTTHFRMAEARLDLPEIAQYVFATKGLRDVYGALREILTADCEPGPVHRFLARLPKTLERRGLEKRYQLIISTSFDTALERAFDREIEPYDLAVYMANGPDRGKFVHFPYEGKPTRIDKPDEYIRFPFRDYELKRTVIVKIHGAVGRNIGDYPWEGNDNYAITEDHYIDYLSKYEIGSLVPVQILARLRESHCLFLGYPVRDWNLRVFLKRIWEGSPDAESWAIEPAPDVLTRKLWAKFGVELYEADLEAYVGLLYERLIRRPPRTARP